MQRVENDFAFVQNRWIADPCAVAINSLFISLFGILEECTGKPVDNISLRKMDKSKRMWERHNWEQKPVMPIWELKMCYFASVPSIWKHSRRHKTENFTSRKSLVPSFFWSVPMKTWWTSTQQPNPPVHQSTGQSSNTSQVHVAFKNFWIRLHL